MSELHINEELSEPERLALLCRTRSLLIHLGHSRWRKIRSSARVVHNAQRLLQLLPEEPLASVEPAMLELNPLDHPEALGHSPSRAWTEPSRSASILRYDKVQRVISDHALRELEPFELAICVLWVCSEPISPLMGCLVRLLVPHTTEAVRR